MTLPLTSSVREGFRSFLALLLTAVPTLALDMSVAMNKNVYYPGEPMEISVTAYNPGPAELVLSFASSCQMYYEIDGVFETPDVCLTVITGAHIPAYGSRTWRMQHSWSGYNPGPGVHNMTAGLIGYGPAGTLPFELVVPDPRLELSLALNKARYQVGEKLEISLTARNLAPTEVTLYFPSSCQMYYRLNDYEAPQACFQVLTQVTIAGFGSRTWRMAHSWSAYNPGLGTHLISGGVHGYGQAPPIALEIVPAERPPGNFCVDFDHLPGSDNPLGDLQGLAAYGLTFRAIAGDPPGLGSYAGNQFLSCGPCTYPTGFNVVIDFAMPVYGITAGISSCSSCSVTLLARAADGTEVARAEASSGAYLQFTKAVGLHSTTPIASVEFWPSKNNAGVSVDECYLALTTLRADFNGDGQVTALDLEHFQACHTGPGVEQISPACLDARLDDDHDVDQSDFGILQRCLGLEATLAAGCPD